MIGGLRFKDPPDLDFTFALLGPVVFGLVNAGVTALALGIVHALGSSDPPTEALGVGLVFSLFFALLNKNVPVSIGFGVINAGVVRAAELLGLSAVITVGVSNGLAVGAFVIAQIATTRHR